MGVQVHRDSNSRTLRWWGGWEKSLAPLPDSQEVISWVKQRATRNEGVLVKVDSLAAVHGGDENDAGAMRAFMNGPRRLADLGATVIVIHHDGKSETSKDFRGSSDFKASLDQAFHVSNTSSDGKLDRLTLRCFKSRYGLSGSLVYSYQEGQLVRLEREVSSTRTVAEQLTTLLRENPQVTKNEFERLGAYAGFARAQIRTFLDRGVNGGSLVLVRGAGRAQLYSVSEPSK